MRVILEMLAIATGLGLIRASDNPSLPWWADLACVVVGVGCLWFALVEPSPSEEAQ